MSRGGLILFARIVRAGKVLHYLRPHVRAHPSSPVTQAHRMTFWTDNGFVDAGFFSCGALHVQGRPQHVTLLCRRFNSGLCRCLELHMR